MMRDQLEDLLKNVPAHVKSDPAAAWHAGRVRRMRYRAVAVAAGIVLIVAGVAVVAAQKTPEAEPARSPEATYVRLVQGGDGWRVVSSDGTEVPLDLGDAGERAPLAISPDGRWLAYSSGSWSESNLDFFVRGADDPPRFVSNVAAVSGPHFWSPDSRVVLASVVDGDYDLVDNSGGVVRHGSMPGVPAGFVDTRALSWIRTLGLGLNEGLSYITTDLVGGNERSVTLDIGGPTLDPGHDGQQFYVEAASVSPDGSRVAVLLENAAGDAPLFVFSTRDGAELDRIDSTTTETLTWCPIGWDETRPILHTRDTGCVVEGPVT